MRNLSSHPLTPALPSTRQWLAQIISPALSVWLRTQLSRVEGLHLEIHSSNRQLLRGEIPRLSLRGRQVVYEGIHLTQVELEAKGVMFNLPQVLQGKPWRLCQPVWVGGEVCLGEADLNASLARCPLEEFWNWFWPGNSVDLVSPWIILGVEQITLGVNQAGTLRTGLNLADPHTLVFIEPVWLPHQGSPEPLEQLAGHRLDLGPEVKLHRLHITPGHMVCQAEVLINVGPGQTEDLG